MGRASGCGRATGKGHLRKETGSSWEMNAHGCLGLCHAVPVDIGGVEVKVPIFVMEDSEHDLLLGRPMGKDGACSIHQ